MKKFFILIALLLPVSLVGAFELPTVHSTIMLDAYLYNEADANTGTYDTSNRVQVRKAALVFTGMLDKKIDYSLEIGVSTCQGSGTTLKLLDAVILYHFNDNISAGLQQGHIIRGFAGATECSQRLTLEKPIFFKTFATCHPTGFVLNSYFDIGDISALEAELALMNGPNSTLDGEHDYNLGVIFYTPIPGISISADYNLMEKTYYDALYNLYSKEGYRAIGGIKYDNYNISFTGEYFMGKGFTTDDQEMKAYYLEAGYAIPLTCSFMKYLQPYVMYEYWDKNSADDAESEYTYFNGGLTFRLTESTRIKLNYKKPLEIPESASDVPTCLTLRLQTEL